MWCQVQIAKFTRATSHQGEWESCHPIQACMLTNFSNTIFQNAIYFFTNVLAWWLINGSESLYFEESALQSCPQILFRCLKIFDMEAPTCRRHKNFATDWTFFYFIGHASTHRENLSITTNLHLLPSTVLIMSTKQMTSSRMAPVSMEHSLGELSPHGEHCSSGR